MPEQPKKRVSRQSIITFVALGVLVIMAGYTIWSFVRDLQESKPASCDLMKPVATVQQIFDAHADARAQITALAQPGTILVEVGTGICQGKADILISFGTESQSRKIKTILGSDFFGVPYRLNNR